MEPEGRHRTHHPVEGTIQHIQVAGRVDNQPAVMVDSRQPPRLSLVDSQVLLCSLGNQLQARAAGKLLQVHWSVDIQLMDKLLAAMMDSLDRHQQAEMVDTGSVNTPTITPYTSHIHIMSQLSVITVLAG